MVEHRLAVGGEPYVALEARRAEPRASRNASSVFSGAWARAPRWANPMGRWSDGRRVGTLSCWLGHTPRGHPTGALADRIEFLLKIGPPVADGGVVGSVLWKGIDDDDQGELRRVRRCGVDDRRCRGAGLHQ